MKSEIILFASTKGGVGKTTLNRHIPTKLARDGYKVCVVDLDDQGNASRMFGSPPEPGFNSFDFLDTEDPPELYHSRDGVDILPANYRLPVLDSYSFAFIFKGKAKLRELAREYDYLFIDTPGMYGNRSAVSLAACDRLYIPVPLDELAIDALKRTLSEIDEVRNGPNSDLTVAGFIPSMVKGIKDGEPARLSDRAYYKLVEAMDRAPWLPFFVEREVYRQAHADKVTIWDKDNEEAKNELNAIVREITKD